MKITMYIITVIWLLWCSIQDVKSKSINLISILMGGIILIVGLLLYDDISYMSRLYGAIPGLLFLGLNRITKGNIGVGDGAIIIFIGILYGLNLVVSTLMVSFFLVFLVSLVLLTLKKLNGKDKIPFIPYLLVGLIGSIL